MNDNNILYDWSKGSWKILKLFMKEPKFLIYHQINSFNLFLDKGLKNIIEQFNPILLNYDFVTQQKFRMADKEPW